MPKIGVITTNFNEAPALSGGECWCPSRPPGTRRHFNEAPALSGGESTHHTREHTNEIHFNEAPALSGGEYDGTTDKVVEYGTSMRPPH